MSTSFPTSLDTLTNPSASDYLDTAGVLHDEQHANVNDAVEALQAKVGVDASAVTTSLDYKLKVANSWSGVISAGNVKRGTGSPEGAATGNVGDVYMRTDGSTGTAFYVKETGTGNTGWRALSDDITKATGTTKGDLLAATGSAVWTRVGVGTDGYVLNSRASATPGVAWRALTSWHSHTFAIPGTIDTGTYKVPFFVPVHAGTSVALSACRHRINSGTSATCKLTKNGSDITGFTGMSVTSSSGHTNPDDVALADGDLIALVVTAVSSSPADLTVSLILETTYI